MDEHNEYNKDLEIQSSSENETSKDELNLFKDSFNNLPRKIRRSIMKAGGYVKHKNKLPFDQWLFNIKNNIENGKQIHSSNTDRIVKQMYKFFDEKNESVCLSLKESGYDDAFIHKALEMNLNIQEKNQSKKLKR